MAQKIEFNFYRILYGVYICIYRSFRNLNSYTTSIIITNSTDYTIVKIIIQFRYMLEVFF